MDYIHCPDNSPENHSCNVVNLSVRPVSDSSTPEASRRLAGDFSHRITVKKECVPAGTPETHGLPEVF